MAGTLKIEEVFRLNASQKRGLAKLGLKTIGDLLRLAPSRYLPAAAEKSIAELKSGDFCAVTGLVTSAQISRTWRSKIPIGEIVIADAGGGKIKAIWFHQPYLAKQSAVGQTIRLVGKVSSRQGKLYLANPQLEPAGQTGIGLFASTEKGTTHLTPIYPETRGLSSSWFAHHLRQLLRQGRHQELEEPLPQALRERYHLPPLAAALIWLHAPRRLADAEAARKRFAFEEVFLLQLERLTARQNYRRQTAFALTAAPAEIKKFMERFPFRPTDAQRRAAAEIIADLKNERPMMRLLEGDVGSGKTAVAATAAWAVVGAGLAAAYMAPTEILARQHFESFIQYFRHLGISVGLLTGSGCFKFPAKINPAGYTKISRTQLLKWVSSGQIPILVGTHALLQKTVRFKNLALAIIDEQHRFGVIQRARLVQRSEKRVPHLLSMTATPIPRTLALTVYGDLDLSLLDEMPANRKPVITEVVNEGERAGAYEKIRNELRAGRQIYVICPRIYEPDPAKALALNVKSAKAEARRLATEVFPEFPVGLLHSKLTTREKERVMSDFAGGKIKILVATSVVEVGVNVENATVIVIEGAERFGLAQLHQLRGRVLRSARQSYCYLFTTASPGAGRGTRRLRALQEVKSGFALAELDLRLRGPGSLTGTEQWGLSDIGMSALQNLKMVAAAREEAAALLAADPELKNNPLLAARLGAHQSAKWHLE